jgi:oligosaccharide repeat unit polymerase
MHSAATLAGRDRDIARRPSSHAKLLHWWARPHAFTVLFLIPLFVICALLSDEIFLTWKHAQNFVSLEAFATGLSALGSFALAAWIASHIGARRAPSYGIHADRLIARAQYRAVVYCIFCVTLAAYVVLLGPAIRNPGLAVALYAGQVHPSEMRESLDKIPGISSFVNLGPLYVTLLLLQGALTGTRLSRFDKAVFALFLVFVTARVFLWSERLALIEVLIPIAIIRIAPMTRHRVLVAMLPLLGVLTLGVYFGVTEYFRSWAHTYSNSGLSFTEFAMTRFLGYYATAVNNGSLIFTTFDPLYVPYGTARWYFKFPLFPAPDADTGFFGRTQMVFWTLANPEFNNSSGMFAPINDFGFLGGMAILVVLGAITGRLLVGFTNRNLLSMLLFPTWMTGVYELLRIFYWGDPRYFPILAVTPVVLWLLSRSSRRRRRLPDWTFRGVQEARPGG